MLGGHRRNLLIWLTSTAVVTSLLVAPTAAANPTITAPGYPSADCTPQAGGLNLGLAPQQWNTIAGLPLTPSGTPAAQRIVIGEFDETASEPAVNLLLAQCGLSAIDLIEHVNSDGQPGANVGGLESTLDVTVAAAALPANATITIVNSPIAGGWYGLFVNMAEACGLVFAGNPWTGTLRSLSPGPNYPAGGCIISLSYGGAEIRQGDTSSADYVLDQLAANGVVIAVSAGDEGSGGCISASGSNFGNATLVNLTNFSAASNVATLTSSSAHGFTVGQIVFIGALAPQLDGNYRILSVPNTTSFTVGMTTPNQGSTAIASVASVNFGTLQPQYPATNPNALAVGGTQWTSQANSLANGLSINYVPGASLPLTTWWDSFANSNCANLADYSTKGGEATGGGQSAQYSMPAYQQSAATASYPSAAARRMMPDVAALAGWPTYAIANPGLTVQGVSRTGNVATLFLGTFHGLTVGERISVSLLPSAYSSFQVTNAEITAVTSQTLSYANTGVDVGQTYVSNGQLTQSCTTPCSASTFPWYPVVGTSAATPLTAIGIANVNAVLSARGLPRVTNNGSSMDIHSIVYSSTYSSARTDVTTGSNDIHSLGGYTALTGYDMATGMGTIDFSILASRLISTLTPSSGGGQSAPATTTPATTGDPVVVPPVVIAPDPVQEVVTEPPVRTIGPGVKVATGPNTAVVPRVVIEEKASRTVREAPRAPFAVKRWRVAVVSVPGESRQFTAQLRIDGKWRSLAAVTSGTKGRIALPALRIARPGNYRVGLTDAQGRSYFIVLRAR